MGSVCWEYDIIVGSVCWEYDIIVGFIIVCFIIVGFFELNEKKTTFA